VFSCVAIQQEGLFPNTYFGANGGKRKRARYRRGLQLYVYYYFLLYAMTTTIGAFHYFS